MTTTDFAPITLNICDHSGETAERTRCGFLFDVPQGQVDLLCADCGIELEVDIVPAINR